MTDDSMKSRGEAAWRVIEPYGDLVDIYGDPEEFLTGFGLVPPPAGHLLTVWWCHSEVCNGGFHQFFGNSTGVLVPEALVGYRSIGLVRCAEIVDTAIRMFGESYPRDRKSRLTRLSDLKGKGDTRKEWDPFYELDDRYYASAEEEKLFEAADRYAIETTR